MHLEIQQCSLVGGARVLGTAGERSLLRTSVSTERIRQRDKKAHPSIYACTPPVLNPWGDMTPRWYHLQVLLAPNVIASADPLDDVLHHAVPAESWVDTRSFAYGFRRDPDGSHGEYGSSLDKHRR